MLPSLAQHSVLISNSRNLSLVSHIPWASKVLQYLPQVGRDIRRLRKFGIDCATSRMKAGSMVKDLWYHLVCSVTSNITEIHILKMFLQTDEAGLEKVKPPVVSSISDGALAILAGADTAATAMSALFYSLLSNPDYYRRAQAEVDAVYPKGDSALDSSKHNNLPFLTACM